MDSASEEDSSRTQTSQDMTIRNLKQNRNKSKFFTKKVRTREEIVSVFATHHNKTARIFS